MITPRYYQEEAIDSIFHYFMNGGKGNPLIALPTASGKSLIPALFIQRVMKQWPSERFLVIVHVKELIRQNAEKQLEVWANAPIGIHSAGLNKRDIIQPIIFGGIQSMIKVAEAFGHRDICFCDESHLVSQDENSLYLKFFAIMRKINPNIRIVGMTATKFRMGQGLLTQDGLFTDIIYDLTTPEGFNKLLAEGFLCPLIPKRTQIELDVSNVGIQKGKFIASQLQHEVDKIEITWKAVQEIAYYGQNRQSWIIFASGIEHSNHIAEMLEKLGIECASVHSKQKPEYNDEALKRHKNLELKAISSFSKLCLDEETEILTSEGWVGIDAMTYDHKIASWTEDEIIFDHPKFIIRRNREPHEQMVSLESKRKNIRVTSNHRMLYSTYPWNFKETSAIELVEKKIFIPVSGEAKNFNYNKNPWYDVDIKKYKRQLASLACSRRKSQNISFTQSIIDAREHLNYKIEKCSMKNPNNLTLEECQFIGFWLGDGTRYGGRFTISQSLAYPHIINWFEGVLTALDINVTRQIYKPDTKSKFKSIRWCFSTGKGGIDQRRKGISHLEMYLNKEGCDFFHYLKENQLIELMYGFWMADGNHGDGTNYGGHLRITGTQFSLYSKLQAALVCRGYQCNLSISKKSINEKHAQSYAIYWTKAKCTKIDKNLLKLENDFKKERVWCVTSITSYIITRRKGKVVVMGNTTGLDHPGVDLLVDLQPTLSIVRHIQKYGRGMRLHPNKKNCLALDFAKNIIRLGCVNDPILPRKKGDKEGTVPIKICDTCGVYNHIKAIRCDSCGAPFEFKVKIVERAGTEELIRTNVTEPPEALQIETFDVTYVTYAKKQKAGKNYIVATYFCGMKSFKEGVFPENIKARKFFANWWRQRHTSELPDTTDQCIEHISQLRAPRQIRVHTNRIINGKNWPEVLSATF